MMQQNTIVDEIINDAINIIDNGMNNANAVLESSTKLKMLSPVFKNASFFEEKEWRIIHTPLIMGNRTTNDTTMMGNMSDIYFRNTENDIISYFKFDMKDFFNSELIPEIILGPKSKISKYDIEIFLSINKLQKTIIKKSKAPYR